jgi:Spy/CpxP family protein refolding chaperone
MKYFADDGQAAAAPGAVTLDTRLPVAPPFRAGPRVLALAGVVVFASGIICGATATRMHADGKELASWDGLLERVANRMQRELHLSQQQRQQIGEIVKAHQPELDRIRARTLKETRSELQQVIEEMSAVLTPEQDDRFRSEAQSRLDVVFPPDESESQTKPGK